LTKSPGKFILEERLQEHTDRKRKESTKPNNGLKILLYKKRLSIPGRKRRRELNN
jgi:hypothetical protein